MTGICLAQAAHLAHVLLAAHAVNHRAGGEEEQRLEERVRHQVEDGGRVGRDAAAQEHVAELRDGGVGSTRLMSVCTRPMVAANSAVAAPMIATTLKREGRPVEEEMRARDHVDAGRDHRGRVDERGDRRRAFHRVGQPDVERKLRALAGGADEQAQCSCGENAARPCRDSALSFAAISVKVSVPKLASSRNMPIRKPKSPMRLTMKAFLPASAAEVFWNQKPMSRYEPDPRPPSRRTSAGHCRPAPAPS